MGYMSAEHEMIRQMARDFADAELVPIAGASAETTVPDRPCYGVFPCGQPRARAAVGASAQARAPHPDAATPPAAHPHPHPHAHVRR